ncbi:MAG: WYL domain-containing protein [Candidatus Micrarchaeia archaeon]
MLDFLRALFGSDAEGAARRAALFGGTLDFTYYSPNNREVTERGVRVARVWRENGRTYFEGYCGLRRGKRCFRLDRVVNIQY